MGDIRVQEVRRVGWRAEFTIMDRGGRVDAMADGFLRTLDGGTDRTYAYLLVEHLRWLAAEGLRSELVELADLKRYMGAIGAAQTGPQGTPWRMDRGPYGQSTLKTAAACLKGFYKFQASRSVNVDLGRALDAHRLPTRVDRGRSMLGHLATEMPANPIAPKGGPRRRRSKLPPEGATKALLSASTSARDRMVVTWLAHGAFRVGELCSLHLMDLHLREKAACGEAKSAHVHICHREANPNNARVKTKREWQTIDEAVVGGTVRLVSPDMIHTYFEYMSREYPAATHHGMLLVQCSGARKGAPLTTDGVRALIARISQRAGIGFLSPHAFRHQFATDVLEVAKGNTVIARDAGGWASARTVEEIYVHMSPDDPIFTAALKTVWGVRQ